MLLFLTGEVEIEDACRAIRAEVEKSQDPDKVRYLGLRFIAACARLVWVHFRWNRRAVGGFLARFGSW